MQEDEQWSGRFHLFVVPIISRSRISEVFILVKFCYQSTHSLQMGRYRSQEIIILSRLSPGAFWSAEKMGVILKMTKCDLSPGTQEYQRMELEGGRATSIRVVAKCKPQQAKCEV